MAKEKTNPLVTAVVGLTQATEALNVTARSIFEIVNGAEEVLSNVKSGSSKPAKASKKDTGASSDDLSEKTIQELRQIAKKLGIPAGGSKASLIKAIESHDSDESEDEDEEDEEDEDESDDEDEEEEESDEEDEDEDEIDLDSMDADELVALAKEHDLKAPKKKKGEDEDDYAERLREFLSENLSDEEDEDEDEEDDDESDDEDEDDDESELSVDDLDDMDDDELKDLLEQFEIELEGKYNRKKAIKAITKYIESEDED